MRNTTERTNSLELISDIPVPAPQRGERIEEISLEAICPNQKQVRTHFAEEQIQELANSIESDGLLSPLVVRPADKSLMIRLSNPAIQYELIAGERRLRALKLLKRLKAPCIVRAVPDSQMRVLALIENVQREDLGILEKASSMLALKEELGSIEKVSETIHKSRSYGFMLARIGELPEDMRSIITKWNLSTLEANELASLFKDAEKSNSDKVKFAIRSALLSQKPDASFMQSLRVRYMPGATNHAKAKKYAASNVVFSKTKKAIGLKLRFEIGGQPTHQQKQNLVKETKRFFEALGVKSFDIRF